MIVVMKADATQEQLDAVKSRIVEEGLRPSVVEGAERNIVGVLGTITRDHESAFGADARRPADPPGLASLQAGEPRVPSYRHRRRGRRRQDRRRRPSPSWRGLARSSRRSRSSTRRGRSSRPGATSCAGEPSSPAPRPTASAALASKVLNTLAKAREETGLPVITEVMTINDVPAVSEYADIVQIGAAQHAELQPARRRRRAEQAGDAQARSRRHHRRVAARRRVHPQPRQPQRHPLRARRPDLRDGHPQHARHLRRARRAEVEPPADRLRPQPRHRQVVPRAGYGGRLRRGRRRRSHGRGPPRPPTTPSRTAGSR